MVCVVCIIVAFVSNIVTHLLSITRNNAATLPFELSSRFSLFSAKNLTYRENYDLHSFRDNFYYCVTEGTFRLKSHIFLEYLATNLHNVSIDKLIRSSVILNWGNRIPVRVLFCCKNNIFKSASMILFI